MSILDERLQPCRFCGTMVAVNARRCPNCAGVWPSAKQRKILLVAIWGVILATLAMASCFAYVALSI